MSKKWHLHRNLFLKFVKAKLLNLSSIYINSSSGNDNSKCNSNCSKKFPSTFSLLQFPTERKCGIMPLFSNKRFWQAGKCLEWLEIREEWRVSGIWPLQFYNSNHMGGKRTKTIIACDKNGSRKMRFRKPQRSLRRLVAA